MKSNDVLHGDQERFIAYVVEGLGDRLPSFGELPLARLMVPQSVTLREIKDATETKLGIDLGSIHWIFLTEPAGGEHRRRRAYPPIVLVGNDESFFWPSWDYDNVSIADLGRTRRHGFFHGDPYALLFDTRPYGNGALVSIEEVLQWLALLGGASAGAAVMQAGARRLRDLLRVHFPRWFNKGAKSPPQFFFAVLSRRSWTLDSLAAYLSLSHRQIRLLLETLGYLEKNGLFERSENAEHSALRNEIIRRYLWEDPIGTLQDFEQFSLTESEDDEG